jgi:hypothetical protein
MPSSSGKSPKGHSLLWSTIGPPYAQERFLLPAEAGPRVVRSKGNRA